MRILSIHIRNLNSLAGDWSIRLDGPEYDSRGHICHHGPHGRGQEHHSRTPCVWRSTALTPRLEKVTKSSNEIMSRQTSECLAEGALLHHSREI